ncbi:MAG: AMP-binding protein, partial [Candidatus Lambdaproteobacteria bacterium]|nr:AMP-binding protein [Candidatus Lambdaproteobacteria bacterium]
RAASVLGEHLRMTRADTIFMASPVAHVTGMFIGMVLPIMLGAKAVLQDVWNPLRAAQLLQDEAVTMTSGATPFLADLTRAVAEHDYDISSFRLFHAGGSPIPRVLAQQASESMGIDVTTAWGMSELGLGTSTSPDDPPHKLFSSDGRAVADVDVRVVDEQGAPLPPDTQGRLQIRCASLFVGYLKRPADYGVDADGWFDTGDNARMDAEGYIRITGRSKDIIIRGGENIPVAEVEELLYRHPAVQDAAIVAMPDERLGERGCAFVVLRPQRALSFQDMLDYLSSCGLARNYFPERLEIIAEMPRTLSGKIQKFKLRETAQAFSAQPREPSSPMPPSE